MSLCCPQGHLSSRGKTACHLLLALLYPQRPSGSPQTHRNKRCITERNDISYLPEALCPLKKSEGTYWCFLSRDQSSHSGTKVCFHTGFGSILSTGSGLGSLSVKEKVSTLNSLLGILRQCFLSAVSGSWVWDRRLHLFSFFTICCLANLKKGSFWRSFCYPNYIKFYPLSLL